MMPRGLRTNTPVGYVDHRHVTDLHNALFSEKVIQDDSLFDKRYHYMMQLQKCVSFLQNCHTDNPFYSKLLAKSMAAIREIAQAILEVRPCHAARHQEHNKYDRDALVKPLQRKLAEVDFQTIHRQRGLMELQVSAYNDIPLDNYDGVSLLLGPVLSMMQDILPHMVSAMLDGGAD